jgi:hypothetical protein
MNTIVRSIDLMEVMENILDIINNKCIDKRKMQLFYQNNFEK